MKKQPCTSIIKMVLLLFLTLPSCKKVEDSSSIKNHNMSNLRVISECYSEIDVVCDGVLHFNTIVEYENTIDCIEESYETWNTDFETQNDFIDDEQWNNLVDSLRFDEEYPFKAFSNYLLFTSYYNYIDSLERVWVDVYNCDSIHDPDLVDIVGDDAEASVLNRHLEVMIGDTIYKFYDDGVIIKIYGMDCIALKDIRADSANVHHYSNAYRLPPLIGNTNCGRLAIRRGTTEWDGVSYKLRARHKINYFFQTKDKTRSINYKKKSNGKFRRWAISQTLVLNGYEMAGNGCVEVGPYYESKTRTRKKIRLTYKGNSKYWFVPNGYNYSYHLAEKTTFVYGEDSLYLQW